MITQRKLDRQNPKPLTEAQRLQELMGMLLRQGEPLRRKKDPKQKKARWLRAIRKRELEKKNLKKHPAHRGKAKWRKRF